VSLNKEKNMLFLAQTTSEHFSRDPLGSLAGAILGVVLFLWIIKFFCNIFLMVKDGAEEINNYSKTRRK
jgi:hypothetical protein